MLLDAQAAATRDMREHQLATTNLVDEMSTAVAASEKKTDRLVKLVLDGQAASKVEYKEFMEKNKLEKLFLDGQAASKVEMKKRQDAFEKLLLDAQAAATRDMREHQLATTNLVDKMSTVIERLE